MFRHLVRVAARPAFLGVGAGALSWCEAVKRKETSTGVEFDEETKEGLHLRGCGVRVKYGFVKVYAVAMYTDPALAISADEGDAALALRGSKNELQFAMTRALDAKTFVDALEEQLFPRVADRAQSEAFAALGTRLLPEKMPLGYRITIRFDEDGRISLLSKDAPAPTKTNTIRAPQVADAFLEIYLGADAVSPSAREDIIKGLRHAL